MMRILKHRLLSLSLLLPFFGVAGLLHAQEEREGPAWLGGFNQRYELQVVGEPDSQKSKSILARIPTGGRLADGVNYIPVQLADGRVYAAAVLSNPPTGDTLVQFLRHGNDTRYWVYLPRGRQREFPAMLPRNANIFEELSLERDAVPLPKEGLTVEYRDWEGDELDSWPQVVEGLQEASSITGNAIVREVRQYENPFRPADARNFAASFRGYIELPETGVYRFFVNSNDASFLFLDGSLALSRPGGSPLLRGRMPIAGVGEELEIPRGIYPIEIHAVVGDSPRAEANIGFIWIRPSTPNRWEYVPRSAFVQAMYADVTQLQQREGQFAPTFSIGQVDTLESAGLMLFLVQVQSHGNPDQVEDLVWDMGDGTEVRGKSHFTHVYLSEDVYHVTLTSGDSQPFRQSIAPYPFPAETNPNSLARAVEILNERDWSEASIADVRRVFSFLMLSHQPNRWELQQKVAQRLVDDPTTDLILQAQAYDALAEAMGNLGQAQDAADMLEDLEARFERQPSLVIMLRLRRAELLYQFLREAQLADFVYEQIINDFEHFEHPNVRLAAVRWGDMLTRQGNLPRAATKYRLAQRLGGQSVLGASQVDMIRQGALLRRAEQLLRQGDIRGTRQILREIESNQPEQRMEALSRFLVAETDRLGGRYDDAIRTYEYLLNQPQWSGHRNQVMFSIADTFQRMDEFGRSMEWLTALREASPEFFEREKLGEYQAFIEERITRIEDGQKLFQPIQINFDPEKLSEFKVSYTPLRLIRGLGLSGTRLAQAEAVMGSTRAYSIEIPMTNIRSEGLYWAELIYRENLGHYAGSGTPLVITLTGSNNERNEAQGRITVPVPRTFGQWRRVGGLVRAPVAQDGHMHFRLSGVEGVIDIDSFRIEPVEDFSEEALQNFIDGYAVQDAVQ